MWIKADMHIHSIYSDGRAHPRDILLYARDKGLKAVAITDHDTFNGALVAAREAKNLYEDLVVVIGCEVRSDKGDVLVYCREPFDPPRELGLLIDKSRENNCLVVPAHPFDTFRHGVGEYLFEYSGWNAIEVWNASSTKNANRRAVEAAKLLNLPGLANSDAHILEYVGVAYTLIDVSQLAAESVMEAILKGRVKPVYGYPSTTSLFKRVAWSVERRFKRT